jgi:hypothetical protein
VPAYRLEYVIPGQRSRVIDYASAEPLKPGQRIYVEGAHLLVERVVQHKPGDAGRERVMCRLVT